MDACAHGPNDRATARPTFARIQLQTVGRLLVPAAVLPSKPPTDLTLLVVLSLLVRIPSQEEAIGFEPDVRIPPILTAMHLTTYQVGFFLFEILEGPWLRLQDRALF
jgi:hypothetical protein